jgi:vesicle-fusing ATPase
MRVPPISNLRSLEFVLREVELFPNSDDRRTAIAQLLEAGFSVKAGDEHGKPLQIGIKKLLSIIEMARQEPGSVTSRLTGALMGLGM